jgi:hypothetical protein
VNGINTETGHVVFISILFSPLGPKYFPHHFIAKHVRLQEPEVFTAVNMKVAVFWNLTQHNLVEK